MTNGRRRRAMRARLVHCDASPVWRRHDVARMRDARSSITRGRIDGRGNAPESCAQVHDSRSTESHPTGRGDAAMATKKKGGSKRSAGKSSARRGGAKRGAKRSSAKRGAKKGGARKGAAKKGAAKKGAARKSAAKKSSARGTTSRGGAKRGGAKKSVAKRSTAKRSTAKRSTGGRKTSPLARVKRVATGVVEQAQTAVSHGVDAVKELGENIVDRVSG
jgi:hypothetical protein